MGNINPVEAAVDDRHVSILVVNDEPDIRDSVADVLSSEGYAVDTAANGLEALQFIRTHAVDLVLLDLTMPVMDGWTFQTFRKRDPRTANLKVIAISAMPHDPAPFDARLRKPFSLDQLLAIVARLVPHDHVPAVAPG